MVSRKKDKTNETDRQMNNQKSYDEYVRRIEARIAKGETLEVKPFQNWIRKGKDKDGNEVEVAGDSGETKHERFVRLVENRMTTALTALDTVMNLSSNQYDSTEAEQAKIVNALKLKVLDIENSFKAQSKEESRKFKL